MPCAQHGCPYEHRRGRRDHGFCCNACNLFNKRKFTNDKYHTNSCSGAGKELQRQYDLVPAGPLAFQAEQRRCGLDFELHRPVAITFKLPSTWMRGDKTIGAHISWYAKRYDVHIDDTALQSWVDLDGSVNGRIWPFGFRDLGRICSERELTLHAYAQNNLPWSYSGPYINVAQSLDCRSEMYDLKEITGVDFRVQAVVAAQPNTPKILLDAVQTIECENATQLAFLCHGGTHRSVAWCILLATLVYPRAKIHLTTKRTQLAAESLGCTYATKLPSS